MSSTKLIWFITGANSGFGLLLTKLALSKGHVVVATARDLSKFPEELKNNPSADLVEAQITASGSDIANLVDAALSRHRRIDVLVNNAGFSQVGAAEEVSEAEARNQFDVNFFGLFNFTKAVIPRMRKQGSGTIVQISSGAGILGAQGGSLYSASKFAVEGFSEAMATELKPFGIRVHLVEPGIFRTGFLDPVASGQNLSLHKEGYPDMGTILSSINGQQPGNPQKAVERIFEVVTDTGMGVGLGAELRIPLGSDVFEMLQTKIAMLNGTFEKLRAVAVSTDY